MVQVSHTIRHFPLLSSPPCGFPVAVAHERHCRTLGFSGTPLIAFLGMVPYEVALTAVFVEGFVFVGLTVLGIRQWLAR
jgi:xanthine/uracil/vitamin C permease (AzgA family)